jgi:pimeloyl-ACP methyl ester carboxylesterase
MTVTHGTAEVQLGFRLHYATAGAGERTVVLLHGFPQTWYEWWHVFAPLVDAGFRVVAPDYRGAGHSWRPAGGYDKLTRRMTAASAAMTAQVSCATCPSSFPLER